MDKFEELKDYILSKILEYQNELEKIKSEIKFTDDKDTNDWSSIDTRFQDCINHLVSAKNKEIRLKVDEQEVRAMLEGFYENDCAFYSFVYHVIFKVHNGSFLYRVEDKYFKTLEEAEKYSISLGENGNWLKNAYLLI